MHLITDSQPLPTVPVKIAEISPRFPGRKKKKDKTAVWRQALLTVCIAVNHLLTKEQSQLGTQQVQRAA